MLSVATRIQRGEHHDVTPAIAYQRNRYAEWGTDQDKPKPEPMPPEELPWEKYFVDTPDQVAEGLIALYEETPFDRFCFWGRLPGLSHEQAMKSTRIFASEVAPKARDAVESV
jgi:alkanesulfonate monooxygenase SsuD/methylene tetrahydromethanopterin reductase-like flavin-dependent oxidoreductase (luciferase family)